MPTTMRLSLRDLHNLPVETPSGASIGRLVDVEIDVDEQTIRTYHVRSRTLIPGLFGQKLLIDRSQVVSLTKEKLIVDDAVALPAGGKIAPSPEPNAPPNA